MSAVRDNNHLIADLQILHNCRAITLALKELEIEGRATNAGLLLIYEGILTPTPGTLIAVGLTPW